MPSFAISQFIILLEPLWVPAVFLLLSTGPLLYIIFTGQLFLFVFSRLYYVLTVYNKKRSSVTKQAYAFNILIITMLSCIIRIGCSFPSTKSFHPK